MEPTDISTMATIWLFFGAALLSVIAFRVGWKVARSNPWKRQKGF